MTEDQAKTKWCPMVRFGMSAAGNTDSQTPNATFYKCRASDCMMWRYESGSIDTQGKVTGERAIKNGHCGLAGKP